MSAASELFSLVVCENLKSPLLSPARNTGVAQYIIAPPVGPPYTTYTAPYPTSGTL